MKPFLKIIIGLVVVVLVVAIGVYIYQQAVGKEEPGKNKFSIEGTMVSANAQGKTLTVKIEKATETLSDKVGSQVSLKFSDSGTIKGKSGSAIELANLTSGVNLEVKGTISGSDYVAEYIIEK